MDPFANIILYGLFAVFLIVGLVVYERTGMRLGGVVVLPLLVLYALIDVTVLAVFAGASVLTLGIGNYIASRSLWYGRRIFILFLILGVISSVAVRAVWVPEVGPFALAILPGLFAYNLHREGNYFAGISNFAFWLGMCLSGATFFLAWFHGVIDVPGTQPVSAWLNEKLAPIPTVVGSILGPAASDAWLQLNVDQLGAAGGSVAAATEAAGPGGDAE